MFKAIGLILVLWYLATVFSSSFTALDSAATETFRTLEAAAVKSQENLK